MRRSSLGFKALLGGVLGPMVPRGYVAPPNPAKGKGPVRSCGMSESRQLVGDGCCEREPREGLCGKGPLTVKRGRGLDDIFVLSF